MFQSIRNENKSREVRGQSSRCFQPAGAMGHSGGRPPVWLRSFFLSPESFSPNSADAPGTPTGGCCLCFDRQSKPSVARPPPLVCNRGFPSQFATRQRSALLALTKPFSCFLSKRRPAKVIGIIRWMATSRFFYHLPQNLRHHRERKPSQQPVRREHVGHWQETGS